MTETAEPAKSKPSDIGSKSTPDTLAAFKVNPDQGLTNADVDVSRKENGYNEVAEQKKPPRCLGWVTCSAVV
jgi:H+-transporting ATPase